MNPSFDNNVPFHLNDRQKEIAEKIRQIFKADSFDQLPLAYGLSESLALLIDGINHVAYPQRLEPVLSLIWNTYLSLIAAEQWYNKHMKTKQKSWIGRDPACGRVSFKTGVILSQKNREGNRNTKIARKLLRRQLRGE